MHSMKKSSSSNAEEAVVMESHRIQIAKDQIPPKPAFQEPVTQEKGKICIYISFVLMNRDI